MSFIKKKGVWRASVIAIQNPIDEYIIILIRILEKPDNLKDELSPPFFWYACY